MERRNVLTFLLLLIFICCGKEMAVIEEKDEPERGRFRDDWTYDVFIEGSVHNNDTYKLWIPEGINPRAILVLSAGGGGDGTGMVADPEWRAFAEQEKLALLGTHVISNYEDGSNNLKFAVKQIAQARGLEYISNLPYLLRGHSSGGRFSYIFSQVFPISTIAWANFKGSLSPYTEKLPPGLFIIGEDDLLPRNQTIEAAFLKQREIGSIAVFAVEPNAGHGGVASDPLIRNFFSSILNKTFDDTGGLSSIDITEVLLGNNESLEVMPYAEYSGIKKEASCLIDTDFAEAWVNFVTE